MRSLKEIKDNYNFTSDDEQRLNRLKPVMEVHVEEIAGALSSYIMSTKIGARLLTGDTRKAHLFEAQKNWFMAMFDGKYDHKYYEGLIKIGFS